MLRGYTVLNKCTVKLPKDGLQPLDCPWNIHAEWATTKYVANRYVAFCFQLCAPIALFFVTGEKHLVPIAIQLFQDIAPDNPVSVSRCIVINRVCVYRDHTWPWDWRWKKITMFEVKRDWNDMDLWNSWCYNTSYEGEVLIRNYWSHSTFFDELEFMLR